MNATYKLDRVHKLLFDAAGRCFDARQRVWRVADVPATGEDVDGLAAATWLQRESGFPLRVPVGVIGPREADGERLAVAEAVGRGLAGIGLPIICGGRQGIMEAASRGATLAGGLAIGLLPEADPSHANPYVSVAIATGIGEARNALIARAAYCLIVIGDSYGTLSELALGLQFGKTVIGLSGAAPVDGVIHVATVEQALSAVACLLLAG